MCVSHCVYHDSVLHTEEFFVITWRFSTTRDMTSSLTRFFEITRRATVGRTPLGKWSVRRRVLYLTTHTTHNRQPSLPPVGFETTIAAGEQSQTYALDRAATGTGTKESFRTKYSLNCLRNVSLLVETDRVLLCSLPWTTWIESTPIEPDSLNLF
jgi:hypothetical protein